MNVTTMKLLKPSIDQIPAYVEAKGVKKVLRDIVTREYERRQALAARPIDARERQSRLSVPSARVWWDNMKFTQL